MDKWQNKVAMVTGASAGIGVDICKSLVESGMLVIGLARRKEKLDELSSDLEGYSGKFYSYQVDITKESEILQAFTWITDNVGPVNVLINNAGVVIPGNLYNGDTTLWQSVIDTNLLGVAITSREAIKIMQDNDINGYIININSVCGQYILDFPNLNMYHASKHGLRAMTEVLRLELARLGSNIRVTDLSPGLVKSEIFTANEAMTEGVNQQFYDARVYLEGEDIAHAIIYLLSTPLRVQVTEITIRPIRETNSFIA